MLELEELGVLAARLDFNPDAAVTCSVTTRFSKCYQFEGHLPTLLNFFSLLHQQSRGSLLRGSLIVFAEDCIWSDLARCSQKAPILAFGSALNDPYSILMPDPAFIGSRGHSEDRARIEEMHKIFPWNLKQPTVFWRGTSTGSGLTGDDWKEVPRIALCLKAKEIGDNRKIDCGISKLISFSKPEHEKRIVELDILKGYVPFEEFLKYRYQVDVDGFANAWISCFSKLASHSLTLKVESTQRQWYYHRLQPWKHYIPLASDLSNLGEVLTWLPSHDAEAQQIAENAASLMSSITFESETSDLLQLLSQILARQI
jgi:hypothetical protein